MGNVGTYNGMEFRAEPIKLFLVSTYLVLNYYYYY
jgi:hypothetical protein